jgi:ATP-dependent DNA helicase RecG
VPRPALLDPLLRSLRSIKGVGPQLAALLARFFGAPDGQDAIALDVLMHMPSGVVDRRRMVGIGEAYLGQVVTLKLHIDRHQPPPRGKPNVPHRVFAHDETGDIQLVYFRAQGGWVEKALPVGEERYVSGEIGFFNGEKQITHPDYVVEPAQFATLPLVEPVYPLTHGLSSKVLVKLVRQIVQSVPELPEWIPASTKTRFHWPDFYAAMQSVHIPETPADTELWGPNRMRLAYDEYLAGQLALLLVRSSLTAARGVARSFTGALTARVEANMPYSLTAGQRNQMEPFYPLRALVCHECFLVQLEDYETPDAIFSDIWSCSSSVTTSFFRRARARRCRRPGSAARGRSRRHAGRAAPAVPAPVDAPGLAGPRSPRLLGAPRGRRRDRTGPWPWQQRPFDCVEE